MAAGSAGPRGPSARQPPACFLPPARDGRGAVAVNGRSCTGGPAGPVPGTGPRSAGGRPGAPGQVRTYTLAVRVIAELYPPLASQRRWAFQNGVALSRGHLLIRA